MKRFYIQCVPIRRGLTGREYLAQYIDEVFPSVKFYSLFTNGLVEFGYLEGDDENLCNALAVCENIFSMQRLFLEEFRGAAKLYWKSLSSFDGEPTQTLEDLFNLHSIEIPTNFLNDIKAYKIKLLKEKVKKEFYDYNDLVANIAKEILLLTEYRETLTSEQATRLDSAIDSMKSIYSADDCLDALEEDISKINSIMPNYYATKSLIQNAIDTTSLIEIDIIGT